MQYNIILLPGTYIFQQFLKSSEAVNSVLRFGTAVTELHLKSHDSGYNNILAIPSNASGESENDLQPTP